MKAKGKKLSALLSKEQRRSLKGQPDPVIQRLAIDSRRVIPGSLFFALPGLRSDGNSFVDEAIARGAVAVVSAQPRRFRSAKVAYYVTPDPRAALAEMSRAYFDFPDEELALAGVTGTNGKTTVAYLVKAMLAAQGREFACFGTVGYDLLKRTVPSFRTTPEALDLCDLLSQVREFGGEGAVMEVSSHGLHQKRLAGFRFQVAAFLNLTRDHLDYHGDMKSYFAVKRSFFNGENGPVAPCAVVNIDDPYGEKLVSDIQSLTKVTTFSAKGEADLRASEIELDASGTRFELLADGESFSVLSPLVGDYNVSNVLAAIAICRGLGCSLEPCVTALRDFKGIPGRMQAIRAGQDAAVFVDYAHTEDALQNALRMLRAVTKGKLRVVFGCGGDRDRGKRPGMTRAANTLADEAWATSDNPRSESLQSIFEDMREGVEDAATIHFVEDRRHAIEEALRGSVAGDCVLIAGKGHESFQEYAETVVPFDDRKVAMEVIENLKLGGRV